MAEIDGRVSSLDHATRALHSSRFILPEMNAIIVGKINMHAPQKAFKLREREELQKQN